MGKLRRQLDAIAADVVNYQCDVSIQVPRTEDYPWLATLLTKRVKKLDSDFDLKLEKQILAQCAGADGAESAQALKSFASKLAPQGSKSRFEPNPVERALLAKRPATANSTPESPWP